MDSISSVFLLEDFRGVTHKNTVRRSDNPVCMLHLLLNKGGPPENLEVIEEDQMSFTVALNLPLEGHRDHLLALQEEGLFELGFGLDQGL